MTTLTGTSGDDILGGTTDDDTITGLGGADSIFGGDGNDTIDSGPEDVPVPNRVNLFSAPRAADYVSGGNGNDTITGGPLDILDGGAGNDTIELSSSLGSVGVGYVFGGDGDDTIFSGLTNAVVDAGAGADVIRIAASFSAGFLPGSGPHFTGANATLTTGSGADVVNPYGKITITDFTVSGAEADRIDFASFLSDIRGTGNPFSRDDGLTIFQDGADTIIRSVNFDGSNATIGAYRLDLRLQNVDVTTLTAANFSGNDPGTPWIAGGTGGDMLSGTGGADRIHGFAGDDTIIGGGGDDTIIGGAGADTVTGGGGADRFIFSVVNSVNPYDRPLASDATPDDLSPGDRITDFQTGVDKLVLAPYYPTAESMTVVLTDNSGSDQVAIITVTGTQVIEVNGFIAPSDVIATNATVLVGIGGTNGDDAVSGTAAGEYIFGFDGNDVLQGLGGVDRIFGGDGDDVVSGGAGADLLDGGAGSDRFTYAGAADSNAGAYDTISNFEHGIDKVDLSALGATAISIVQERSGGTRSIFATTPQGTLQILSLPTVAAGGSQGPDGSDLLTGGLGVDIIAYSGTFAGTDYADNLFDAEIYGGRVTLIGGLGADHLYGSAPSAQYGGGTDTFKFVTAQDSTPGAYDTVFNFETGYDKIDVTGIGAAQVSILYQGAATFLFAQTPGGLFQVAVVGAHLVPTDILGAGVAFAGTPQADTIRGSEGDDRLSGGDGNDMIQGDRGADVLTGGAGADTFQYTVAGDSPGGAGDLITDFQHGADRIEFKSGYGPTAIGIVQSGGSSFVFANTSGSPIQINVIGDVEGTDLFGVGSGITLQGDDSSTTLTGTVWNDTLFGNGGIDVLNGSFGADVLFGGAGADVFRYLSSGDSYSAARDLIADFQTGIDKIDLTDTGVTAIGIAGNILFGSGPNGINMQIGFVNPVALSDVILNSGPAPAPLLADAMAATHGMDGAMF